MLIRAESLTHLYPGNDRPTIHNAHIEIKKNEFIFLTGSSGSGKTSLLRLFFGLEQPTEGLLEILGEKTTQFKPNMWNYIRQQVGYIFQDFRLVNSRTIFENVAFPLYIKGLSEKEVRDRTYPLLRKLGIFERAHMLPPKMSGGEQQRAAIARAIIHQPKVILADEPTGNLDQERSLEVISLLEQTRQELGSTIILATHDRTLVKHIRDARVFRLYNSELTEALPEA